MKIKSLNHELEKKELDNLTNLLADVQKKHVEDRKKCL